MYKSFPFRNNAICLCLFLFVDEFENDPLHQSWLHSATRSLMWKRNLNVIKWCCHSGLKKDEELEFWLVSTVNLKGIFQTSGFFFSFSCWFNSMKLQLDLLKETYSHTPTMSWGVGVMVEGRTGDSPETRGRGLNCGDCGDEWWFFRHQDFQSARLCVSGSPQGL